MQDLSELNLLIDRAASIAGSDYKLAQALGVSRQRVSNWRHGQQACSPEDCALIAMVAGLDPMAELARAIVRKHEGSRKGEMLRKALGKPLLVTGAALATAGAHAGDLLSWISGSTAQSLGDLIRCISGNFGRQRFAPL